ncbi:MAG: pyridoxal-phosphate dependent enzyme, partial [Alphaproteobacteria bacterium]|nr:pyridoxal-phosphate dependent enzyme [Alphaproteobacteria bacterium]
PRNVMAGYTVMTSEIKRQLEDQPIPTHVFIQGGVGGLAGAVCTHLWQHYGANKPRFVVVEPDRADCIYQSGLKGETVDVHITEETVMAGLSCGEVSNLGWDILKTGTADFMTITDDLVAPTMKLLAKGVSGDPAFAAGESAVAGLAGALAALANPFLKSQLNLDENSRILVIGTEGATDPEIYEQIVGIPATSLAA